MAEFKGASGINTLMAGIIGAAVGASLVVLGKRDTRTKIKATIKEKVEEGEKILDQAEEKLADARDKGRKRLIEELEKTKQRLEEETSQAPQT